MINDNPAYPSSTENGNPIHQSSSDNLTHQQPSSDNLAQFIRMIGNLSPADRQALASALSSSPSPETDSDPFLSTKPAVKTLEPYNRLEECSPVSKSVTNPSTTPRLTNWMTTPTSNSFTEFSTSNIQPPPSHQLQGR
ncbi:hypothetical protein K457DRAFT_13155 [Linnemannia elongata AG-77]|uniref:Uncharacterized protein n=1 Tax=Linnemannia elongata AG-77 TaxID=1314771 RepID=A0A197KEH9_9FUNG|nr:hypothetical protein K457DRAFT_13155 [Linnemannia elongata AG-77]